MSGRTSVYIITASIFALLALLSGCSGRNAPTNPENEQWFCQSNESGEGWECVQDENLALIPVPTRMPPEPEPEEDPAFIDLDDPLALETLNAPLERNPDTATIVGTGTVETTDSVETAESAETVDAVVEDSSADPGTQSSPLPQSPVSAVEEDSAAQPPPLATVTGNPSTDSAADVPRHVELAYSPPEPMMITQLPSDFFALQMLTVNTQAEIEAYIQDNGLIGMSGARVERDGEIYYVLIVGIYETYGRADEAAKSLPPPLDDVEIWIRPLGSLQQAMLRADELNGSSRF